MKNEIKKQYIKSIFFTLCPFVIPLTFMIPTSILNIVSQILGVRHQKRQIKFL